MDNKDIFCSFYCSRNTGRPPPLHRFLIPIIASPIERKGESEGIIGKNTREFFKTSGKGCSTPFHELVRIYSAGMAVGVANAAVFHPVDALRIRYFFQKKTLGSSSSFLNGITFNIISTGIKQMAVFPTQEVFKKHLQNKGYDQHKSQFYSGLGSGVVLGLIASPINAIKVPQQASRSRFRVLNVIHHIYKERGVKGFWRGGLGIIIRDTIWSSVYFPVFGYLKEKFTYDKVDGKGSSLLMVIICSSTIAGVVSYPFDGGFRSRSPPRRRKRSRSNSSSYSRSSSRSSRSSSYTSSSRSRSRSRSYSRSPRRRRKSRSRTPENTSLHVGNLTGNVTGEHLKEIFGKFGKIRKVDVVMDLKTQLPRGYSYIEYVKRGDAEQAKKKLDGGQIDGKTIKVQFTIPRRRQKNIPWRNRGRGRGNRRYGGPPRRGPPPQRNYGRRGGSPYSRRYSPPGRRGGRFGGGGGGRRRNYSPSPKRRRRSSRNRSKSRSRSRNGSYTSSRSGSYTSSSKSKSRSPSRS